MIHPPFRIKTGLDSAVSQNPARGISMAFSQLVSYPLVRP